jgi:branched-subunit amino acid transport protein
MNKSYKNYLLLIAIIFLMTLTRNSHSLTSLYLPDATFAVFFIGGYNLKNIRWFSFLLLISTLIDVITSLLNPSMNLWHNISYFGMIFTYGAMWLGGLLSTKVRSSISFIAGSLVSTVIAFIISTQTYNLLSGTFPGITINQSLQTGWEYLPQSIIYTMSYLLAYWGIQSLFKRQFVSQKATAL